MDMIITAEHRLLAQEGHLASASLLSGFEALAKIDYDRAGTIYSTLFALSIGMERIMKIAVILNHKAANDLANPTDKQLKALGHSITELYEHVRLIGAAHGLADGWFEARSHHYDALEALSEFALGSRYYNFDQLTNGKQHPDPLVRWFKVHIQIAEHVLSHRRLERIMGRARAFCEARGALGWEWGPLGRWELTIDVNYQICAAHATRGQCVWAIIEILKPVCQLIEILTDKVQALEVEKGSESATPYMIEFFPFRWTPREAAIRRKAWSSLFHLGGR
ncbi:MAG: hypothetical protein V4522_14825 [Pseudomonadota bacterium]|nr:MULTISPECIES: hypothetical protein [unclassified Sphingomonas]MDR6847605.1 hypothetical protein [Sphingomonas sp. BE137]